MGILFRHAIVEELAGLGAKVYTCARNEAELNKCLVGWKDEGFAVMGSVCDVSNRVDRAKLIGNVSDAFDGSLNILVSLVFVDFCNAFIYCCDKFV